MEHHDVVNCGIFADEFRDKGHRERTKHALRTPEAASELYLVWVIAEASF